MTQAADNSMQSLVDQLAAQPGVVAGLPAGDAAIVRAALAGADVYTIAQAQGVTEGAIWAALTNAARTATGQAPTHPVKVGGLGSDPSPGDDATSGDPTAAGDE